MELLLLTAATSADIFAAALGLGTSGVKFPALSAAASAFISAAAMVISAVLAAGADRIIPLDGAQYIPKAILMLMGIYAVLGERSKKPLGHKSDKSRHYGYAEAVNNPVISDRDSSKSISFGEAAALGAALSADSVLAGISAGIAGMDLRAIFPLAFACGMASALSGTLLGGLLSGRTGRFPAGAVSGAILIVLAVII